MKNRRGMWVALLALGVPAVGCGDDSSGGTGTAPTASGTGTGTNTSPTPTVPATGFSVVDQVRVSSVDKIDLLFMVDNSASMADKQKVLAKAVPDLVNRLINPACVKTEADGKVTRLPKDQQPAAPSDPCPAGASREFSAIKDIHIGVVSSSLGGHGSDYCSGPRVDGGPSAPNQDRVNNHTQNDRGRLITRGSRGDSESVQFPTVPTYVNGAGQETGFFNWDPTGKATPPGESNAAVLANNFRDVILGTDQIGCGYEASLESWYRFLIDPTPPESVSPSPQGVTSSAEVTGIDETLLKQRAEFLRPDSLVAIINLSDENDCSIIDGKLPAKVCDEPEFDPSGKPTGCKTELKGWPAGYVEGNFERWEADDNGLVTGVPFPVNHIVAQQKLFDGTNFWMASGTPACTEDPYSPACTTCYNGNNKDEDGDGKPEPCADLNPTLPTPVPAPDAANLRCWNQKQRFGIDFLYPLKRYVAGLTETQIYDRNGYLVPNPLYDDLPLKAGLVSRGKAEPRNNQLVFYASIVGVPWQDIARDPKNLKTGYKPAQATADEGGIDWDLVLGNPFAVSKAERSGPKDPLMVEQSAPRTGTHPITNEAIGESGWNSINGHEWKTDNADLQYACVFDLEPSTVRDCSVNPVSCDCATDQGNPLCEKPTADGKGDGVSTTTQFRAKAFPGTRFLQVAKDVGNGAVVASICAPNLKNESSDDFGYRPAVASIVDRLKTQLTGRCVGTKLPVGLNGAALCVVAEGRFQKIAGQTNDPAEVKACQACDQPGHRKLDPAVVQKLSGASSFECVCEVTQLTGADRDECQTKKELGALSSGNGGWCYVDPFVTSDPAKKAAQSEIVAECPASSQRTVRFTGVDTSTSTLLIACY
jgi:hypothetical protein